MSVLRVLHVDDEADIREVVEIALGQDPEMVVSCCASGQEALAMAVSWSPDIILLDVMMPAMDGPATLRRLRESPEAVDIPIVFMTARAQSREIDAFRSLGAVGVIPKPFDPMILAALVRSFVAVPETRLSAMRNEFLVRLNKDIVSLTMYWSAFSSMKVPADALEGMKVVAHGLAGAGGIFGFEEISLAAATLEEAVTLTRDGLGTQDDIHHALDVLMISAGSVGNLKHTYRVSA